MVARSHKSKVDRVARERHFLKGLERLDPALSFGLLSNPWTIESMAALVRERLAASTEVAAAKAVWEHAIQKERGVLARTEDELAAIRSVLLAAYGDDLATLASLGLRRRKKKGKMTIAERVAMAEKMRATRAARKRPAKR